jgi:replication factor A1
MSEEKVGNLKPNQDNVSVTVRVLEASEPKVIQTKSGPRTISEAIVGDDTGRVKLTLWGQLAGKVKQGMVVKIENAWTTAYRGKVQLNAGSRSKVTEMTDSDAPSADQIPTNEPEAPNMPPRRNFGRRPYNRSYGGYGRRSESEEEEE